MRIKITPSLLKIYLSLLEKSSWVLVGDLQANCLRDWPPARNLGEGHRKPPQYHYDNGRLYKTLQNASSSLATNLLSGTSSTVQHRRNIALHS